MPTFGEKSVYKLDDGETKHLNRLDNRFTRWHDKQMSLMTFCINLLFTLSLATLGFIINNSNNVVFIGKFICGCALPKVASSIVVLSSVFGILALGCRLLDFRCTKNIIRTRKFLFKVKNKIEYEYAEELTLTKLNAKIEQLKSCAKNLGGATWLFFVLQSLIFLVALITIVASI